MSCAVALMTRASGDDVVRNICTIDGCGRFVAGRGWCNVHYARWRRHGDPLTHSNRVRQETHEAYLAFHSDRSGGPDACWPWDGGISPEGYGIDRWHGQSILAHRASYEHFVGQVPAELSLDHGCHNPKLCHLPVATDCPHRRCVNPAHLEPMTSEENTSKGRRWAAEMTHCKHGHSLEPGNANLRVDPRSGVRCCRACSRERMRGYRRQKVAA